MAKDYRDTLRAILKAHPEIAAINVEFKHVDRITIGDSFYTPSAAQIADDYARKANEQVDAEMRAVYVAPSGLKPVINNVPSPELIRKLKGSAYEETIKVIS